MRQIYLTLVFFLWISCDKIEPPYTQSNNNLSERTVLIEKFTGHKCSNCPEASRKVDELQEFYGNNLISVAIHPGDLIEFTGTDDNYPYDFTTNASDTISNDMGASFLPLGTVNRIPGGISNRCWTKEEWATQIDNLLYDNEGNPLPNNVEIEINTSFNKQNKELSIQTDFSLNNNLEGNYKLCLFIMEDGIIAPQIDGTEYIENYEHKHIYRSSVNTVYGEDISEFSLPDVPSSEEFANQFMYSATHLIQFNSDYNINWNEEWNNVHNCYVVAYIYNSQTLIIEESAVQQIINE